MIYLDNAATSLMKPPTVTGSMSTAVNTLASLGRGGHVPAQRAAELVYNCRETAAKLFGVKDASNVVFTQNATHALNIAIFSLLGKGGSAAISGYEHNAVTRPLHALGAEVTLCGRAIFDPDAALEDFRRSIPGKSCVVCTHVSNVFGYVLPIYEIGALCRENGVPLIVDASQSAGILDVDMGRLGAAFVAMPGHKSLFGPQGTGILLCGAKASPIFFGGSGADSANADMPAYLPERLEAGTQNVCGIAGLKAGMEYVMSLGTKRIHDYETRLLTLARRELSELPGIKLYTGEAQSSVLSFTVEGRDTEELAAALSRRGVCVRAGLHCAPLAHQSAGTADTGTLRMSFSPFNSENEVIRAANIIKNICKPQ